MDAIENKGKSKAFDKIADNLKKSLIRDLKSLSGTDPNNLIADRYQKFRKMGEWV